MSPRKIACLISPIPLSGCCYFVPCHPSTHVVGVVLDAQSNKPIPAAAVRLYFYTTQSASSGCFAIGGADALPFEFGVSVSGYKPIVVKAARGSYKATVKLVSDNSFNTSTVEMTDISNDNYAELSHNCR